MCHGRLRYGRDLLYGLILAIGSVAHGFGIAYPSPVIPQIASHFTKLELSIFNSITALVAVAGPYYVNYFMVRHGRKAGLRAVSTTAACAWLCLLSNLFSFKIRALLHRVVFGLAMGGYATIVPVYIMELSPVERRTVYGTLNQLGISLGVFLCYLIGAFVRWKALAVAGLMLPVLQLFASLVVPESPAYLHILHEHQGSVMHPQDRHFDRETWKSIFSGILLLLLQQLSGINPVQINMSNLMHAKTGPAIAASAKLIAGVVCVPLLSIFGREFVWVLSCIGCAMSLYMIGATSGRNETFVIIATFVFLFSFCLGLGPMPWFLIPEMFDDSVRPSATALLTTFSPLFAFLVTFAYPYSVDLIGCRTTFTILSITMVLGAVYGLSSIRAGPVEKSSDQANPLSFEVDLTASISSDSSE